MRFRQRHVHATIYKYLSDSLGELGWYGTLIPSGPTNFGAAPVVIMDYEPQQAGETPAPNTVAVSIDHQGTTRPSSWVACRSASTPCSSTSTARTSHLDLDRRRRQGVALR
jgi:hypothetical protein